MEETGASRNKQGRFVITTVHLLQIPRPQRNDTATMQSTGTESNRSPVKRYQKFLRDRKTVKLDLRIDRIIPKLARHYKSKYCTIYKTKQAPPKKRGIVLITFTIAAG